MKHGLILFCSISAQALLSCLTFHSSRYSKLIPVQISQRSIRLQQIYTAVVDISSTESVSELRNETAARIIDEDDDGSSNINTMILGANASISSISAFLLRSAAVGGSAGIKIPLSVLENSFNCPFSFAGIGILAFKKSILLVSQLLYESLADVLPKPAFYWPIILYPVLGSVAVSIITYTNRDGVGQNIVSNGLALSINYLRKYFTLTVRTASLGPCAPTPLSPGVRLPVVLR
jgi:hypothetical protein